MQCLARGQIDRFAMRNLLFAGHLVNRRVTAMVTDMVICDFHAPVTLPRTNSDRGSLK
jgi:hypothetical protein